MDVQGHSCDGAWLSSFNLKEALTGSTLERVHQTGFDWGEQCEAEATETPLRLGEESSFPRDSKTVLYSRIEDFLVEPGEPFQEDFVTFILNH